MPSELSLDCFELAREVRELDMRASPYDLRELGVEPVRIETSEGKAEYVAAQRAFSGRAQALRARLVDACDELLGAGASPSPVPHRPLEPEPAAQQPRRRPRPFRSSAPNSRMPITGMSQEPEPAAGEEEQRQGHERRQRHHRVAVAPDQPSQDRHGGSGTRAGDGPAGAGPWTTSWPGAGSRGATRSGRSAKSASSSVRVRAALASGGAPFVLAGVEPAGVPVRVEGGHRRVPLGGADAHRGKDAAGAVRFVLGVAHPSILPPPGRAAGEVRADRHDGPAGLSGPGRPGAAGRR